jgi:hypothetical protein
VSVETERLALTRFLLEFAEPLANEGPPARRIARRAHHVAGYVAGGIDDASLRDVLVGLAEKRTPEHDEAETTLSLAGVQLLVRWLCLRKRRDPRELFALLALIELGELVDGLDEWRAQWESE